MYLVLIREFGIIFTNLNSVKYYNETSTASQLFIDDLHPASTKIDTVRAVFCNGP